MAGLGSVAWDLEILTNDGDFHIHIHSEANSIIPVG